MTEKNREQAQVEEQEPTPQAELGVEGESEADVVPGAAETGPGQEAEVVLVEGELVVEEEPDEATVLREQLAEAEAQAAEYLDGWQRARAEFANYRRREEQRRKQMESDSVARVLRQLLPVIDDLERAFSAVPEEVQSTPWVEGLSLVAEKLAGALKNDGLSFMSVQPGDAFDPGYHEAVLYEPSPEYGEGQIVEVLQRGYKLNEIVLRPALVRVSSGRVQESDSEEP